MLSIFKVLPEYEMYFYSLHNFKSVSYLYGLRLYNLDPIVHLFIGIRYLQDEDTVMLTFTRSHHLCVHSFNF